MGWGTTPGVCLPRPEGMLRGGLGCHVLLAALPGCGHQMAPRARCWIRTGRRCEFKHCRWVEQPGSSVEQGRRLGTCLGGTLWWANLQHEAPSLSVDRCIVCFWRAVAGVVSAAGLSTGFALAQMGRGLLAAI